LFRQKSGRSTELCSRQVVTAWSPGWRRLFIRRLSMSVALYPKTRRLGSVPPKNPVSLRRVLSIISSASSARSKPVLPGFTPWVL
jgi:hypothetical protein